MKRAKPCTMKNTGAVKCQRREVTSSEHCSVPRCTSSAKYSYLSFHSFPADNDLRKKWLINIRREKFAVTGSSKVCARHFLAEDIEEPTPGGLRRLRKGAVPLLFQWNSYATPPSRPLNIWERRDVSSVGVQVNTNYTCAFCSMPTCLRVAYLCTHSNCMVSCLINY